jgi:hypothetical protein
MFESQNCQLTIVESRIWSSFKIDVRRVSICNETDWNDYQVKISHKHIFTSSNCEKYITATSRVVVELSWTRARAFNPRFGQSWTYPSRSSGSDGMGFLSGRVTRARTFVRRMKSNRHTCSTNWIEQAYLSVESSIRISAHTKSSNWEINPRIDHRILFDGLNWTSNPVRRIDLSDQPCPSPSPGLARVSWP